MSRQMIDLRVFTDPSWWHWTATVPILILYLNGLSWAIWAAAGLCALATGYFLIHTHAVKHYSVQIRIAYLGWLMVGLLPWMSWMHWIQLAGTSAMVTVGYCPLARLLRLLPFNRSIPLTWSLFIRSFFRDPCAGGLVGWSVDAQPQPACCSIRPPTVGASCSLSHHLPNKENQHAPVH